MLPVCLRRLCLRSLVAPFVSLFTEGEAGADVDMSTPSQWGYWDRRSPITTFSPEGRGADLHHGHKGKGGLCTCSWASEIHTRPSRVAANLFRVHTVGRVSLLLCSWVLLQYSRLSFCLGSFVSPAEGNTVWTGNSSPGPCKYLGSTCCCC